jgi:hypothetical protein
MPEAISMKKYYVGTIKANSKYKMEVIEFWSMQYSLVWWLSIIYTIQYM